GDLSHSGITAVNLNFHEQASDDNAPDQIVINGPATPATVDVSWDQPDQPPGAAHPDAPLTHVQISTQSGIRSPVCAYRLNTAVPKAADTLHVNTGGGNDTVRIHSTQPNVQVPQTGGHVYVNTWAGDDQITVGGPTLDEILGPLDVDAGPGHNQITFDEGGS